jgi:dienelactone hydrolase
MLYSGGDCYSNTWACNIMQTVKEFIEKVKANGNKDVTLYMYPGEGHGFMNGGEDIHKMMKSKFTHCQSYLYV